MADLSPLAVLADLSLQPNEEGQSIVVATTGESTAFVVGTTFVDSAEPEPTKGRLLVLAEETERRAFDQVNELEIGGCPYALAAVGSGHVAAAINSQVSFVFEKRSSAALTGVHLTGHRLLHRRLLSGSRV